MSKSIQIKAGTTRQKTALTVALKIHINTSIKHQTVNKAYNIRKTQTAKIRYRKELMNERRETYKSYLAFEAGK